MDTHARRRARQKTIQADLRDAYTDEEATPPEWVDLLNQVRDGTKEILQDVADETTRFVGEADIRSALARRERAATNLRVRIEKVNNAVRRLNLIAPNFRFTRPTLDAEETLRPLFRSTRAPQR